MHMNSTLTFGDCLSSLVPFHIDNGETCIYIYIYIDEKNTL